MFRSPFLALLALSCASVNAAEISVSAASSLTDALKEIGAAYEKQGGNHVNFNFAASNVLARQIEEGAPADLFFSADDAQMDRLEKNGHIEPDSRIELLSNTLVVVALNESALLIQTAADLRQVTRIAVGNPKFVPVGVYARTYLEKSGLWKELEGKIIPAENVRAGLAVVESGDADVAFVYATDAAGSKKVKVIWRVPAEDLPSVSCPVAVLKDSLRKPEAARFFAYLTGSEARQVFEKFSFIVKH